MTQFRHDPDAEYGDEPNFRCPGCEANTGNGRYCDACRDEWERDAPVGRVFCAECGFKTLHTTAKHIEHAASLSPVAKRKKKDESINAYVTLGFRLNNICHEDDLVDWTLEELVKSLIKSEGILGLAEDDADFLGVERA